MRRISTADSIAREFGVLMRTVVPRVADADWTKVCQRSLQLLAALKKQLSGGEADDVLAQLPRDLKDVWEDA